MWALCPAERLMGTAALTHRSAPEHLSPLSQRLWFHLLLNWPEHSHTKKCLRSEPETGLLTYGDLLVVSFVGCVLSS